MNKEDKIKCKIYNVNRIINIYVKMSKGNNSKFIKLYIQQYKEEVKQLKTLLN